ncbi:MAG: restriction endonuclease [Bacteroidetes bacterium]|nr:restriction endonuclease [Bacteroidota bacterium]MBL7105036.1 restriction endonuclease [Bacteroidales bacterium]
MKLQILSNLNYPIGNIINQELIQSKQSRIAVAFMKYTGLKVIESSLLKNLENKADVEIIAGLDFKSTDPQAIKFLINLKKNYKSLKFYCFGDKKDNKTNIVFHPKIYLFNSGKEMTSIIGSTNLTGGGLISNFEVNTVIKEKQPLYFLQLEAIYNSIKFTPSIFEPNEDYLFGYSDVYKALMKNEEKAIKDKGIKRVIKEIERKEKELPGTVPTMKSLIIEAFHKLPKDNEYIHLKDIGDYVLKRIKEEKLDFNLTNYRANLRKTIYIDLEGYGGKYNKELFKTKNIYSGLFQLTNKGLVYEGR